MSFRTRLPVVLGLAVLAGLACEEFPEPLESDAGQIPVELEPVDWPAELALGDAAILEVEVVDGNGAVIQGVDVSWSLEDGSVGMLEANGTDAMSRELTGDALGWAHISMSLEQDPFVPTTRVDSVPILLAGVELGSPADDTTLRALGQAVTLSARGLDVDGNPQANTGLTWSLADGSAVTLVGGAQGDQINVEAAVEGTTAIAVGHDLCVSTAVCSDTIRITVDQVADSVALSSRADTLVTEDTVQLSATAYDANGNAAPSEALTWTSRDPAVATVDGSGQVVAEAEGQTWIVVGANPGAADSASVEVSGSGVLTVDLTDAPADLLASAVLYLNGVYVLDPVVTQGRRYLLDQPFSTDLLTLADTVAALGAARVPAGTYGSIFLEIDSATIMLLDAYTFSDGTRTRTFTVPEDTLVAPIDGSATFADNDTIRVVLDFDVDGSFPMPEPSEGVVSSVSFDPTTRVVDRTSAASIAGALTNTGTADVESLSVRAVRTDVAGDTVFARSGAGGAFKFRYLIAGSYDLSVPRAPACHVANPSVLAVSVVAGEGAVDADFTIDPVTIDSIAMAPAEDTINAIGFTTTLGATAYEGATALDALAVDWSSADPSLATVDGSGAVTGLAEGTARIVAAACGATDTALVTVRQLPASVTVRPSDTAIDAGATAQFAATLADSGGATIDTATFTWASSDEEVATIDGGGLATAIRSGATIIQATHPATGLFGSADLGVLLASAESFSVGPNTACALTATNQVVCWGPNPHGGLGFPSVDWVTPFGPQTIPLPTSETYQQVSAGQAHACALTTAGDIYCWGSGGNGELGNGNNFDSPDPVLVDRPAGETFTDVSAGEWFTCAATASGQAYCWGWNNRGRLGNGTTNDANIPTPVSQSSGVELVDLEAGGEFVCGIATDDAGYCWGAGDVGQMGNGSFSDSFTPVGVSMPTAAFVDFAMSRVQACALGGNGNIYCWGRNAGNWLQDDIASPEQVGTETFVALGGGNRTVCGARDDGSVRCAGANYYGQYGSGTLGGEQQAWSDGASGLSVSALDGSGDTLCGLDTNGDVFCWGAKGSGLTGTAESGETPTPVQTSMAGTGDLTGNGNRFCAVNDLNELYCWARIGHLVGYTSDWIAHPELVTQPPSGQGLLEVTTGSSHTCVLTDAGRVYCMGENYVGQLGDGTFDARTQSWVEAAHPEATTWQSVSAGLEFTCALDTSNRVYCWGWNGNGQIGIGTGIEEGHPDPVRVEDVGVNFTSIEAGRWHVCATTSNSSIYCWGWGGTGQLGNGSYSSQSIPTEISTGGRFFRDVAAGGWHTCGLTFDDEALCWGQNWIGQLGDGGEYESTAFPQAVTGGHQFDSIDMANDYTCAIDLSGGAWCWGAGWQGQFGNDAFHNSSSPMEAYTGMALRALRAAPQTSCAIDTNGNVWCAGSHENGHTGVGEFLYEVLPVRVGGSGGN